MPITEWYISFADESGFLGAVIVEADSMRAAIAKAHTLNINPGGEAVGCVNEKDVPIPKEFMDRLLTREDVERMDKILAGEGE